MAKTDFFAMGGHGPSAPPKYATGKDVKLIHCVLGMMLNSSVVVQGIAVVCAFGLVDQAV